ncbi:MAG: DUF58 domain-containing protein [Deltaproteobacteria bacterium]|nr:DUF58 domain-containing protein [Deltaproteobacteria bacterium]
MLTRELLKKIRKIEITTNRAVNDVMAGQYLSVFKGRGMAFDEVRPYQPGDDIRVIDWNVTARMNDLYVKQFVEERELTVMLLVDASGSLAFGTRQRFKSELAAEITGLLAFSAIKNNDRVGLIMFTDRVERFVPPKKGTKHVLRVISEVLAFQPTRRRTDIAAGVEFLSRVTRRKSVAFLLSDFMCTGYEQALRVANRRHDMVPLLLRDPMERELPDVGLAAFQDAETGEVMLFHTASGRARRAIRRRVEQAREEQRSLFRRMKMDFVELSTEQDYVRPLVLFFKRRAARMVR